MSLAAHLPALQVVLPLLSAAGQPLTLGLALFAFGAALGSLDVAMNVHALVPREPARGPLSGLGIVVTRPARQAGAFAQKLASLGATPIAWLWCRSVRIRTGSPHTRPA